MHISLQWINCTVTGVLFRVFCFVFFFGIQTLIPHVCKASPLSPKAQQWSCGARWHDPVTQTHRRLHSDSGNRPPKQKSSIIYVQQLQPLIQCVGVTCPPLCPIDFLWVTNTAHTLYSVLHLTNLCSIIDMAFFSSPLLATWRHRICSCMPCYIFINIQLCWHSLYKKHKIKRSGKHDLTHSAERKESQRSKHCWSSEGKCLMVPEAVDWPQHATYRAEGNLLKTVQQRPSANTVAGQRTQQQHFIQNAACYRLSFQCNRRYGLKWENTIAFWV